MICKAGYTILQDRECSRYIILQKNNTVKGFESFNKSQDACENEQKAIQLEFEHVQT